MKLNLGFVAIIILCGISAILCVASLNFNPLDMLLSPFKKLGSNITKGGKKIGRFGKKTGESIGNTGKKAGKSVSNTGKKTGKKIKKAF